MNSVEVCKNIAAAYKNREALKQMKAGAHSFVAMTVRGSPSLKRTLEQLQRDNFNQAAAGLGLK